jgi:hypothetical protein
VTREKTQEKKEKREGIFGHLFLLYLEKENCHFFTMFLKNNCHI